MNILVSNDDGVSSEGILALTKAMRTIGKTYVLAPDRNWSATGHVKSLSRPLRIKEVKLEDDTTAWSCDGSPSDCVSMGLHSFFGVKFDLVVTGINTTANLAQDITCSGTVTAAMEAAIHNTPAVAFSLDTSILNGQKANYEEAAFWAQKVIKITKNQTFAPLSLLNVNIPALPTQQIKGFQITRLGQRIYRDVLEKRTDPRGYDYYWMLGKEPQGIPQDGTDIGALHEGFVSISPLHLDMTAYHLMQNILAWNWGETPVQIEENSPAIVGV